VEFGSEQEAQGALGLNKHYIGRRYIELSPVAYEEMAATVGLPAQNAMMMGNMGGYEQNMGNVPCSLLLLLLGLLLFLLGPSRPARTRPPLLLSGNMNQMAAAYGGMGQMAAAMGGFGGDGGYGGYAQQGGYDQRR
jgi:hypothetical protein